MSSMSSHRSQFLGDSIAMQSPRGNGGQINAMGISQNNADEALRTLETVQHEHLWLSPAIDVRLCRHADLIVMPVR